MRCLCSNLSCYCASSSFSSCKKLPKLNALPRFCDTWKLLIDCECSWDYNIRSMKVIIYYIFFLNLIEYNNSLIIFLVFLIFKYIYIFVFCFVLLCLIATGDCKSSLLRYHFRQYSWSSWWNKEKILDGFLHSIYHPLIGQEISILWNIIFVEQFYELLRTRYIYENKLSLIFISGDHK